MSKNSGYAQGAKKFLTYFEKIKRSEKFIQKEKQVKELLKLDPKDFANNEWEIKVGDPIDEIIDDICKEFGLFKPVWSKALFNYFFRGDLFNSLDLFFGEMCYLIDETDDRSIDIKKEINDYYPISIRISPFAKERDILDYVKKRFPIIKILQNRHTPPRIKLNNIRKTKPIKLNRNDFIYKNRKLPVKDIAKLVEQKFAEYLDDGHISKIISLEKIKRNDL